MTCRISFHRRWKSFLPNSPALLTKELTEREDIRDLPLVTIDGETARDFDDAVYCERDGKGLQIICGHC